ANTLPCLGSCTNLVHWRFDSFPYSKQFNKQQDMEKLKITVDQLKNYLGTGLNLEMIDYQSDYVGRKVDLMVGLHQWDKRLKYWSVLTVGGSKPTPDRTRPIVYRLSDLDKEIEHNGERFVPIEKLPYGN